MLEWPRYSIHNSSEYTKLRNEIKENELAYELVVSKDFTCTIILLNLTNETSDNEALQKVDDLLQKYPGNESVYIAGQPKLRTEINSNITRDLLLLLPLERLYLSLFVA